METIKYYNVAVYLRLSRDDGDINGIKVESNSISSQREMIRSYVSEHEELRIFDIYIDDGWSGTNFDRPEFKRMMSDIESGKVNCVIVKDLSRLGRDYIEAGRLIQKTFPAFSVRFIAITDNYDSLTADYNETSVVIPVKNFVNDSYSRDISKKVRSNQKTKREKGEFIGAFTIYGYKKCQHNKNQLEIDRYPADIVKKIFFWKMEGYSTKAIAEKLEKLGILSPLDYKKSKGEKLSTSFATGVRTHWSAVAVKRILTNENYTGTLVQGKSEKVSYKVNKSVIKPEAEWSKKENKHEAIIEREDFEIVQELLAVDTRAAKTEEKCHRYAGVLFCGDCMEPMIRRLINYKGKEKVCFICATRNKSMGCTRHTIEEEQLDYLVLTGIKQQIGLFMDKQEVLSHIGNLEVQYDEVLTFDNEIKSLRSEQEKYAALRAGLYEDLKKHIISEEDFKYLKDTYERKYREMQNAIDDQERAIKKLFKSGITTGVKLEKMKAALEINELDRITLITLVKRIYVYEDKRVYIEFRHKELFSKIIMLTDYITTRKCVDRREAI